MTTPRPITPEERAVIRAAKSWARCVGEPTRHHEFYHWGRLQERLRRAVHALNAKRAKAKR